MKITEFADLIARAEGKKKIVLNAAQAREVLAIINCAIGGRGQFYRGIRCFVSEDEANDNLRKRLRRRAQRTKRGAK